MTNSVNSTVLLGYPIQISDFEFRCVHSKRHDDYIDVNVHVSVRSPSGSLVSRVLKSRCSNIVQPPIGSPLSKAFKSCYSNTTIVLDFLDTYLEYRGLDNQGRDLIININCTDKCLHGARKITCSKTDTSICGIPQLEHESTFAYFFREEFLFGQKYINNQLISISECLTIVAHEIFHAVTYFSCDLEYNEYGMSGALHESYSDIFAVLVNNIDNPDIDNWEWAVGDKSFNMIRYFDNEMKMSNYDARKKCHHNMEIHNFAVYRMICSQDNSGEYLFKNKINLLPVIFYEALKRLGQSVDKRNELNFRDSRGAIKSSARTYISSDEIHKAIDEAFDYAEIYESSSELE
jgi:Zn-dependent metalloprotease